MRKVFLILLIGIVCAISGCGNSLVAVRGTVQGTQENTVIAGALITATGKDTLTTVTGSDGKYRLMLPSGEYEITAAYRTFNTASATVTLKGDPVTKDFKLATGSGLTVDFPEGLSCYFEITTLPYGIDSRSITTFERQTIASTARAVSAKSFNNAPEGYCYELYFSGEFAFTDPLAVQGVRLYSAHSADGPFVLMDAVAASFWGKWADASGKLHDPLLFGSGESYYAVQLYARQGETPLTEPMALAPLEPLTLKAPNNNAINYGPSITLEWDPVAGCSSYRIYVYRKQVDNTWKEYTNFLFSDTTSVAFSGLPGGEYFWYVTTRINAPLEESGEWSRISISANRTFEIDLAN